MIEHYAVSLTGTFALTGVESRAADMLRASTAATCIGERPDPSLI